MATPKKFAGRVSEPLFDQIQVERRIQGVTFENWLKALMVRENAYRRMNRQLVHELSRLRKWHLPFDNCDTQGVQQAPALRPSEDDRYDDLLRSRR